MRNRHHVLVLLALLLLPAHAAAQPVSHVDTDAGTSEVEELMRSIAQDAQSLSTEDCITACKALGSMLRATERLCTLDPGTRCAEARATLEDASRKVRAACPACVVDAPRAPAPEMATVQVSGGANAPQAERVRGGCAGCATARTGDGLTWGALGVAWALARLARRRRSPTKGSGIR